MVLHIVPAESISSSPIRACARADLVARRGRAVLSGLAAVDLTSSQTHVSSCAHHRIDRFPTASPRDRPRHRGLAVRLCGNVLPGRRAIGGRCIGLLDAFRWFFAIEVANSGPLGGGSDHSPDSLDIFARYRRAGSAVDPDLHLAGGSLRRVHRTCALS